MSPSALTSRSIVALSILVLLGCPAKDPEPSDGGESGVDSGTGGNRPALPYKSGSRIKLLQYRGSDGFKALVADVTGYGVLPFRDEQLNKKCEIWSAPDGTLRCMPGGVADSEPDYFSDSTCQQPLFVRWNDSCRAKELAMIRKTSGSCSVDVELRTIGAEHAGATYKKTGTSCAQVTQTDKRFYSVSAPVDPTSYVSFTRETVDIGARVRMPVLRGNDGSVLPSFQWWKDTELGIDCYWTRGGAAGDQICVPFSNSSPSRYADSACTQKVGLTYQCSSVPDTGWFVDYQYSSDLCAPPTRTYYAKGAAYDGGTYALSGNTCSSSSVNGPYSLNLVGAVLPMDRVASSSSFEEVGGDRLRRKVRTYSGYPTGFTFPYDAQLATTCIPLVASDGKLRCVPNYTRMLGSFYEDSACTSSEVWVGGTNTCEDPTPIDFLTKQPDSRECGTAPPLLKVKPYLATPASIYLKSPTTCSPYSVTAPTLAIPVAGPAADSEFMELSEEVVDTAPW